MIPLFKHFPSEAGGRDQSVQLVKVQKTGKRKRSNPGIWKRATRKLGLPM